MIGKVRSIAEFPQNGFEMILDPFCETSVMDLASSFKFENRKALTNYTPVATSLSHLGT